MAVEQVAATIRRHLLEVPPDDRPVIGLSEGKVLNLARTLVQCLDVYGRRTKAA